MNVKYLYNDNQAFYQFFQPNFVGAHGLREIRCEPGPDEVNGASGFRVQRSVNQTTCGLLSRIPSVENRPCHCPVHWLSPGLVLLSIDGPPAHKAFIAHQVIQDQHIIFLVRYRIRNRLDFICPPFCKMVLQGICEEKAFDQTKDILLSMHFLDLNAFLPRTARPRFIGLCSKKELPLNSTIV
jgi:hypothetical protein